MDCCKTLQWEAHAYGPSCNPSWDNYEREPFRMLIRVYIVITHNGGHTLSWRQVLARFAIWLRAIDQSSPPIIYEFDNCHRHGFIDVAIATCWSPFNKNSFQPCISTKHRRPGHLITGSMRSGYLDKRQALGLSGIVSINALHIL